MASLPPSRRRRWIHPVRSVRVRITLVAVLVTGVAVGTAGWLLVRSVEDTQIGQVRDDINADLDDVVARLRAGDDPEEVVGTTPASVEVTDEDGQVVASSPSLATGTPRFPEDGRVADGPGTAPAGGGVAAQAETITRTVPTADGRLTVRASVPVDQVARSVDAVRQALAVGLPALVALVGGLAWVLVGRALRPVEAIRAEVDEISGSTTHRRVPEPPTGDEIGRLARTMNAMLTRLDTATTRQRQFISDASHELRSPVTAIRAALEVARRKGTQADWLAVADTALTHESRLETLLDDLLMLAAQDENGDARRPARPVDLAALVDIEAERPRRVPVHVTSSASATDPAVVSGDPDQLARMITNLVDNATRYATTAVHITLAPHDAGVRLTVDDDGPGVPPGDRQRVFERFARLDHSRARPEGGTGLGLALVHSIVGHHRGRVWIDDSPTGGARFLVELPTHDATGSNQVEPSPMRSKPR